MKNRRGIFITFEGPECAGKTTQIKMLEAYLKSEGYETVITREPGGTEIGEELRQIVKHHVSGVPVTDEAEVLLFAASRAQHVSELIKPALRREAVVICDRFFDSTTAYQGYARGLDMNFINQLNNFAVSGTIPDITILLDLSAEESIDRGSRREETLFVEDRIESEKIDFHKRVRDGFLKIAESEPKRFKIIPAVDSIENIHNKIVNTVKPLL
jgi:dTMP kinase